MATAATTIPMLAELAGRAALVLALAWIGARLAFRRPASTRYAVWAAGFIAAFVLPIATGVLPSWRLAVLPPQDGAAATVSRPFDGTPSPVPDSPAAPQIERTTRRRAQPPRSAPAKRRSARDVDYTAVVGTHRLGRHCGGPDSALRRQPPGRALDDATRAAAG